MGKDILQITITKRKTPKSKIGRWLYWHIWFQVWSIWRPRMLSKFYGAISYLMMLPLPKEKREEIRRECEDFEIQIVNKLNDHVSDERRD